MEAGNLECSRVIKFPALNHVLLQATRIIKSTVHPMIDVKIIAITISAEI